MDIEFVRSRFIKHFDGSTGSVYASPGRINLIGEHTDYNGGFVFPELSIKEWLQNLKLMGRIKSAHIRFKRLCRVWIERGRRSPCQLGSLYIRCVPRDY